MSSKATKKGRTDGISPSDPVVIMHIADRMLDSYDAQMKKAVAEKFGIHVQKLNKMIGYPALR